MFDVPGKQKATWLFWLGIGAIPVFLGLITWSVIHDKGHEEEFASVQIGTSPQSLRDLLSRQDIMDIWYADWVPINESKLERPILYTKHGNF